MMRVALSGGIASGKTTVSNAFAKHGVPIVDADLLAREVVAPGTEGLQLIVERFGADILNSAGALDRRQLRKIVFSNDDARADLEAIVHPLVRKLTQKNLEQHDADGALYCIVVIPLLVETGQHKQYDHVVIVDVDQEVQIDRLMARDKSTREQAQKIISSQAGKEQRLAIADDLIINRSTKIAVDLQVRKLHERLQRLARRKLNSAE